MSIYLCRQGHMFHSQVAADNCARCRNAGRPKSIPAFKLDAAGQLLISAAKIAESQHVFLYEEKATGGNMHPIRALYIAAFGRKTKTYDTAVRRLFDCCGVDFMDHGQDENIDDLVAAAFWEVDIDQRRAA